MKYFIDGNQLCITWDDFVNLQDSPAVFYPLVSEVARTVVLTESIITLPIGDLMYIHSELTRMGQDDE